MFFVAVGFSDEKIARLFDLARIVLQPEFARPAHITLRGPYKNRKDVAATVMGKDVGSITVTRPGSFLSDMQNTIYLGVTILGISDFWRKPDFPEGIPHLSIYDGEDRRFAWAVFNVLRKHKWGIRLNSTPMHILETKNRLETEYLMRYESLASTMQLVTGNVYSAEEIKGMSRLDRIILLNQICLKIHSLTHPSSTH